MRKLRAILSNRHQSFDQFSTRIAVAAGHSGIFLLALTVVLIWAITGPVFHYSDTWQLLINTGTTVITFLMVFLIQSTQNRDTRALQIKLDELIRATKGAHTVLLDLEELSEEELAVFKEKYIKIAALARKKMKKGDSDTDTPQVTLDNKEEEKKNAKMH